MPTNNPSAHPALRSWKDARKRAGAGETAVRCNAEYVAAMARSIGCEPHHLPEDAVALHFAGRRCSPSTARSYQTALTQWLTWVESPKSVGRSTRPLASLTDPDIIEFAEWLESDLKSDSTVRHYTQAVQRVATARSKPARDLTTADLRAYIGKLKREHRARGSELQRESVRALLSGVRSFCRFLAEGGEFNEKYDITFGVRPPRGKSDATPAMDEKILSYLLECAEREANDPNRETRREARIMRAWLKLGFANGLRIGSAYKINPDDLVPVNGVPHLRLRQYKGGKHLPDKYILATDIVVQELQENWLPGERIAPTDCTSDRAGRLFQGWVIKHGKFARTHQMRAFFASWLYHAEKDIMLVRDMMGHAEAKTTERYITLVPDEERDRRVQGFGMGVIPSQTRADVHRMKKNRTPAPHTVVVSRETETS